MSNNFYLLRHIYIGHEEAHLNVVDVLGRNWLGAFESVPVKSPLRRAISEDCPLIHVCLTADRIYWAMNPEHVRALAEYYSDLTVFYSELDEEVTGRAFLDKIDGYGPPKTKGELFKFGEWFS